MPLLLLLGALSAPAHAACSGPYTTSQLAGDLQVLQASLRTLDDVAFSAAGRRLDGGLPCLDTAVQPGVWAAAYRYLGAWYWIIPGDNTEARRWFRISLEIDPAYAWDAEEIDPAHPMRAAWDAERPSGIAEPAPVEGRAWSTVAFAPGVRVLVDGRVVAAPAATLDRPHHVQLVAGTGPTASVQRTWRIDGNALPEVLLAPLAPAVVTPAPADPRPAEPRSADPRPVAEVPMSTPGSTASTGAPPAQGVPAGPSVATVERDRAPAKTPLLVLGSVSLVAAGGVYAMSVDARHDFDVSTTTDDILRNRDRTNALFVSSACALAVGVGLGTWGVALDGGGTVRLTGRF
jgi:hypothetical protein